MTRCGNIAYDIESDDAVSFAAEVMQATIAWMTDAGASHPIDFVEAGENPTCRDCECTERSACVMRFEPTVDLKALPGAQLLHPMLLAAMERDRDSPCWWVESDLCSACAIRRAGVAGVTFPVVAGRENQPAAGGES